MFRRGLRKGRSMKGKRQAARSKNFKGGRKCRKGRSGTKKRRFENRKRRITSKRPWMMSMLNRDDKVMLEVI